MSGGNIVTNGAGYYKADAHITFTGAAGTTVITMYENGMPIPGAISTRTTAAATEYTVTIPFVTRNKCCIDKTISMVVTGAAITDAIASIVVEKV